MQGPNSIGGGSTTGRTTTADGKERAPESVQALTIAWSRAHRLPKAASVVTGGADSTEGMATDDAVADAALHTRPYLVLVCDVLGDCPEIDRLELETFTDEKFALATRAFRCLKMIPEDADREPLLARGKAVPRLILVDALKGEALVFEGERDLKPKALYTAMRKMADAFHEPFKLDAAVKANQKVLASLDKMAPTIYRARVAQEAAKEDGKAADIAKADKELAKVEAEQQELLDKQTAIWAALDALPADTDAPASR